jgi:hypothetical protein
MIEVCRVLGVEDVQYVASFDDGARVEENSFSESYADLEGESNDDLLRYFRCPRVVAVLVIEFEA